MDPVRVALERTSHIHDQKQRKEMMLALASTLAPYSTSYSNDVEKIFRETVIEDISFLYSYKVQKDTSLAMLAQDISNSNDDPCSYKQKNPSAKT